MLQSVGIGTGPNGPINQMQGMFGGVKIIVSDRALEETDVRLFPHSPHRSKRIRKKLIKRFGGEFKKVPCIFRTSNAVIMHPHKYREFERTVAAGLN